MSDVYCRRCGEPWDCTGGLTYTKQSMSWWEFEQLRLGLGCPCCEGEWRDDLKEDETFICSWRWHWMYACEGDQPYSSFPDEPRQSDLPKWYKGEYRDSYDPPSIYDVIDERDLGDIAKERVQVMYTDDSSDYYSSNLEESSATIWVKGFAEDHTSSCRLSDTLYRANYEALCTDLGYKGIEYAEGRLTLDVKIGVVKDGVVTIDDKVVEYVCDWERSLLDYPVVDDDLYYHMDNEENYEDD